MRMKRYHVVGNNDFLLQEGGRKISDALGPKQFPPSNTRAPKASRHLPSCLYFYPCHRNLGKTLLHFKRISLTLQLTKMLTMTCLSVIQ